MCVPVISVDTPDNLLHTTFLTMLHKIETHARIFFRDIKCPDKKADRIAESVALAWKWFRNLARRGKSRHFHSSSSIPVPWQAADSLAVLNGQAASEGPKLRTVKTFLLLGKERLS